MGRHTAYICERTGLALVASPVADTFRIAKESYGPLNPPLRSTKGAAVEEWGRYDVVGERTIYAGSCEDAAYAESLAHLRPAITDDVRGVPDLASLFDNEEVPGTSLADLISQEWSEAHHMPMGRSPGHGGANDA